MTATPPNWRCPFDGDRICGPADDDSTERCAALYPTDGPDKECVIKAYFDIIGMMRDTAGAPVYPGDFHDTRMCQFDSNRACDGGDELFPCKFWNADVNNCRYPVLLYDLMMLETYLLVKANP